MEYNNTMEKTLLDQLEDFFPGVVWTDFKTSKGNTEFWEFLEDLHEKSENAKQYLIGFYKYNRDHSKDSKKDTFKLMLPEEETVVNIPESLFIADDNAFQVLMNYQESLSLSELCKILSISSENLPNDEEDFPVSLKYPSWNNWLCYYDKKHYKFKWDDEINYDILKYHPENPFEAIVWKCQYYYTLLRIGYESKLDASSKKLLADKALYKIEEEFNLYTSDDELNRYGESKREYLIGNIRMGIEYKKNKKSRYYPKNYEETIKEIKSCISKEEYQHNYSRQYPLNWYDCEIIEEIYNKKIEDPEFNFYDLGKRQHLTKLEILNKNITKFSESERNKIKRLNNKMEESYIQNVTSLNGVVSNESNTELVDFVEDKRVNTEAYIQMQTIIDGLKKQFNAAKEKIFVSYLDHYLESEETMACLDEELTDIYLGKELSQNELYLKFLGKLGDNEIFQSAFRRKIMTAIELIKENING